MREISDITLHRVVNVSPTHPESESNEQRRNHYSQGNIDTGKTFQVAIHVVLHIAKRGSHVVVERSNGDRIYLCSVNLDTPRDIT